MNPCVSDLAIDRLLAGEQSDLDATATRDHASSCSRCGALLDDALATRRAFAAAPPPLRLPDRRRRVAAGLVAAAAAAIVALIVWPRGDTGTRVKGHALLGFFVSHAGEVRRGATGEHVRPGDQLELYTTAGEPGWLAVTSIDGAGVRSVYIAPRPIAMGHEEILPLAIALDATLGDETITGIFCPGPFDATSPPDGCTTDRFTLVKDAR